MTEVHLKEVLRVHFLCNEWTGVRIGLKYSHLYNAEFGIVGGTVLFHWNEELDAKEINQEEDSKNKDRLTKETEMLLGDVLQNGILLPENQYFQNLVLYCFFYQGCRLGFLFFCFLNLVTETFSFF